jgi:hypothetical protein
LNSFTPVLIIPWKLTSLYQKPNIIAISRWFYPHFSHRKKIIGRWGDEEIGGKPSYAEALEGEQ